MKERASDAKHVVVFYFPWKELSGGPYYLTRLANALAEREEYSVFYVDYRPGLSEKLLSTNVNIIPYYETFALPIKDEMTLITPVYCAPFIPKVNPESKIVFVNWHNFCMQTLVDTWRLDKRSTQGFLKVLYENSAVFFLDITHLMAQNEWVDGKLHFQFQQSFVPITIEPTSVRANQDLVREGEIHLSVLGRLSDDKVYAILNLFEQIEKIQTNRKIIVHIIGDGNRRSWLTERTWRNIHLDMVGTITGYKLKEYLAISTDILFAMGTSILEGASIGLPCVVIPHNIKPFSLDSFTYLQESKGYALGWYDTQIEELNIQTHRINDILKDVYVENKKSELGNEALAYVKRYHTDNINDLISAMKACTLTYREVERFARRQGRIKALGIPIARVDSTFDGSIKYISLFGMKNVFQFCKNGEDKKLLFRGKPQDIIRIEKINKKVVVFVRVPFVKL